jgi:hypothetical protein
VREGQRNVVRNGKIFGPKRRKMSVEGTTL